MAIEQVLSLYLLLARLLEELKTLFPKGLVETANQLHIVVSVWREPTSFATNIFVVFPSLISNYLASTGTHAKEAHILEWQRRIFGT